MLGGIFTLYQDRQLVEWWGDKGLSQKGNAMSEVDTKPQGQKSKIYKPAILSPVLVVVGYLILGIFSTWLKHISLLAHLGYCTFILLMPVGLVVGIISDYKIHKSKGMLKGRVLAILGIALAVLAIVYTLMV